MEKMFCYQCEETANEKACTISGVCGKSPGVPNLEDLLIYTSTALAFVLGELKKDGQSMIFQSIEYLQQSFYNYYQCKF